MRLIYAVDRGPFRDRSLQYRSIAVATAAGKLTPARVLLSKGHSLTLASPKQTSMPSQDNTLVTLDPLAADGAGGQAPANTAGAPLVAPGVGVNAPAKIDPSLPGVFHPAHRGTPGLDTIEETVLIPGAHVQQAGGEGASQHTATVAAASSGQISGSAVAAAGQGDGSGGGSSAVAGEADGDGGAPPRRPSYVAVLMSDSVGSEIGGEVANGTGPETGSSELGSDSKTVEGTPPLPEAAVTTRGEGIDTPIPGVEEVQQYGGRKIPGNPPFESDDDEDEQENDISHPEGFLRAMPEDESSMRVLELPDGRVQRREEEDEEEEEKAAGVAAAAVAAEAAAVAAAATAAVSGDTLADNADTATPPLTAPSSAQAPPLTSGAPAPSAAEVAAAAVAAPAGQAPRPPTVDAAVFYSAGGQHRPGVLVDAVCPSGGVISLEAMFPTIGGGNDPAAMAAANGGLLSDPGLPPSTLMGPAVALQRARSFSPLEHAPGAALHSVASMPPMVPAPTIVAPIAPLTSPPVEPASTVPAPSFPAPRPPVGNVHFVEKQPPKADGVQSDVLGTGNGPGPALPLPSLPVAGGEGEKPPVSAQQSDQDLQDMLSGRATGSAGRFQTEIKIANLQGPEQEIMRLVMHTHIEGRLQEVEFDFNLDHDHPKQVCPFWRRY